MTWGLTTNQDNDRREDLNLFGPLKSALNGERKISQRRAKWQKCLNV